MSPVRRRFVLLTTVAVLLALVLVLELVIVTRAYAQGLLPATSVHFFDWLSLSGLISLGLVLVRWGEMRERMKDVPAIRQEMKDEFNRVHRKIDKLFELAGTERRAQDRYRFGERIEDDDPG